MSDRRFCTFHVGSLLLGVELDRVQEVMGEQVMTPVPLADPSVVGLLNLRGRIVTAIDARMRLGLASRAVGAPVAHIVVRVEGEPVSLVVDGRGEVIEVDDVDFEEVPETVSATIREYAEGAYEVEGGVLLALDADRALTMASAEREERGIAHHR